MDIILVIASMLGVIFFLLVVFLIYRLRLFCEDVLYIVLNKIVGTKKYKRKVKPIDTISVGQSSLRLDLRNFRMRHLLLAVMIAPIITMLIHYLS